MTTNEVTKLEHPLFIVRTNQNPAPVSPCNYALPMSLVCILAE